MSNQKHKVNPAPQRGARVNRDIHLNWADLIDYIENLGGYAKLEIRFQQGIPIIAENVREQVKFGIKDCIKRNKK